MQNVKEIAQVLTLIIVACLIAQGIFSFIMASLDKSEVVSCLELQEQAREFGGFYLTDWQSEMCEAHNIVITPKI